MPTEPKPAAEVIGNSPPPPPPTPRISAEVISRGKYENRKRKRGTEKQKERKIGKN
jgi:hypothetical protein